jgi:hypothetical protein
MKVNRFLERVSCDEPVEGVDSLRVQINPDKALRREELVIECNAPTFVDTQIEDPLNSPRRTSEESLNQSPVLQQEEFVRGERRIPKGGVVGYEEFGLPDLQVTVVEPPHP